MKKALVTGGAGFLGLYITEKLLARGVCVRTLSRSRHSVLEALPVEVFLGDIADLPSTQRAVEGCDTIFHTAAISGIGEPWERYYRANTLGTANLLQSARECGVSKFVFTSSPSVTFDGAHQRGVDESVPYPSRWLAHYPHSKALAEQMVLEANNQGGMLTCALRPHLIWGPRDKALIPRLIARAKSARLRQVGDGTNLVDMIYVENAADAHLLAADALLPGSPVAGRAYFLSQGEPVRCWEWINEILALYDLPPIKKTLSLSAAMGAGWALERLWKIFGWQSDPPMTRFLALQLAKDHYFDIQRAREDFGFVPKISKSEGMAALRREYEAKREELAPGT
ncbi:MAG: NAD-dependent epimerase/dehydratase family protein [Planctomycetia bacterium]|nr:NAD-dependent epimerase/dehydratase family protein [Planctomycetia bacterium]